MQLYYILTRWIHVVMLMGMTGIAYYLVRMVSPEIRSALIKKCDVPVIRYGAAILLLLTGIAVYLLQAGLVGDGWSDVLSFDILQALSSTAFGRWWLIHGFLTILLVIAISRLRWMYYWPWLAILSLSSYGLTGHTTVHQGGADFLFSGAQIIHLLAAAFWFGSLLVVVKLLALLNHDATRQAAITSLMRFSKAGHIAVAVLIIAGVFNIISVIGWPLHIVWSSYLLLLITKLIAVLILVGLAVINRYYWVPRFSATYAKRAFYIMTMTELLLLLGVMGISSTFATLSPMPM